MAWRIYLELADGTSAVSSAMTQSKATRWAADLQANGDRVLKIESDTGEQAELPDFGAAGAARDKRRRSRAPAP